ncbi:gag-pol polyprotein [Cucumis melo var. makuwa]|uniref:Gag-pol polyprotein n=1 Tax=Cucumis melo var. makuwa TaxID=1194695 RepID=A0A5D3CIP8_CUCMM|nr:gag-pol polyprotein [Cucumis melo var. makuwa]
METINVVVNDSKYTNKQIDDEEDEAPKVTLVPTSTSVNVSKADTETTNFDLSYKSTSKEATVEGTLSIPSSHFGKNHQSSSIIGNHFAGISTRKKDKVDYSKMIADLCYALAIELTFVEAALKDEYWINAMQEELLPFKRNNVWTLVPKPDEANIIGTKWIFKNKIDESGLEAICLLLGISCIRKFKFYQMDVKRAFLNGYLNEELYVAQPKGFVDSKFPQHVYKINKALYVLKQAPKAWGFPKALVDNFIDIIKSEFEMSMVGELSCFLGLQIKQRSECIFISQEKYAKNIVKKFGLDQSQHKRTPAVTYVKIINGKTVDHKLYRSMIGSLLHLTASRLDIAYAIGICA